MTSEDARNTRETEQLMSSGQNTSGVESNNGGLRKNKKQKEELIAEANDDRNWRGIILALLVIAIVISLVALSAYVLQPDVVEVLYDYKYDYDALFDVSWKPHIVEGEWKNGAYIYQDAYKNVMKYQNGDVAVLIDNSTYNSMGTYQYSISNDLNFALLAFEPLLLYRHSFKAKYYIFDIKKKQHESLDNDFLQCAFWGNLDNDIIYVKENDIYYKPSTKGDATRITLNGQDSKGLIKNGIADWVYEEEMLSSTKAFWQSPGSSYLAYATFNDTNVSTVDILNYGSSDYAEVNSIRYPKSGYPNPTTSLYIYDLKSNKRILINSTIKTFSLLCTVVWVSDTSLLVTWSNRYQNDSDTSFCELTDVEGVPKSSCHVARTQHVVGWLQYLKSSPVIGPSGSYFQIEESYHGGAGSFYHVNKIDYRKTPIPSRFVTSGNFEVTKILSFDIQRNILYFISNEIASGVRHVYSVNVDTLERRCITCNMNCSYFQASLSKSMNHVALQCVGPYVPFTKILDLRSNIPHAIERNSGLFLKLQNTYTPRLLYDTVTIHIDHETHSLPVKILLPANYASKLLSVLVDVYGGPGSQKVDTKFKMDWSTYLVTNHDMAIVMFDGRGSGFKGTKILKAVNRRLGSYEIEDQITALQQMLQKHKFLDSTNVAVWGWSYGGYASAMMATQKSASKLFKCAISVAPVTNWIYYDTIYTERYMGSPSYNIKGYNEADLTSRAELFSNFKFLLIHGLADDNVHYQNSAQMEKALVNAHVQFQMHVYTDSSHSLPGSNTKRHFYKLMTSFLTNCFEK